MVGFRVENIYGYAEIVETISFKGNKMLLGGYVKQYDRDGTLVSTGKPEVNIVCSWDIPKKRISNKIQRLVNFLHGRETL